MRSSTRMLRSPRRLAHSTGSNASASLRRGGGVEAFVFRRSRVPDATKPYELPRTASVSTRIRSARVLAGFHRPLRRRTSYRCFSRHAARLSSLVTSLHHTGESLVTRGRRCHRRVRIIHGAATFVQEAKTSKRRLSTRNLRCPRRSAAISRNTHSPTRLERIRSTCCGCDSALGPRKCDEAP